jgi:hypothetical protein
MADQNTSKTSTKASSGDSGNITPVIDLRDLDQAPSTGSAGTAGQTGQTATSSSSAQNKTGINLEDDALLAQAQTVIAPPEKFTLPAHINEKFPDLTQLIKETESMNDDERNYWFQILPIMTEDQIKKFRDILVNEKSQLKRLDKEYDEEVTKLNEKHMVEWKEFESKEKRDAIKSAEAANKQKEQATEEDLLKRLAQF